MRSGAVPGRRCEVVVMSRMFRFDITIHVTANVTERRIYEHFSLGARRAVTKNVTAAVLEAARATPIARSLPSGPADGPNSTLETERRGGR